ncbi:protein kinase [Microbotryomycetes sp. JL201]|nr:protein kinase [Microbotryomycetes sp. JL201]
MSATAEAAMAAATVIPSCQHEQSATTDIAQIELHKENIQPLASGRSASQLAALQAHSRTGLGTKLALEHKLFQAKLDAIDEYERTSGEWTAAGQDADLQLSLDDVQHMAEDPLDVHHQYARFVIANYPAGNSATSRLVPVLELATRKFVNDVRYRNDPRYLRLWNLYAKHIDSPQDCYRFLFAKNIGDKLATLYEEFALVLEQQGRRTEADKVYALGIHRFAMPLDRLKRRYKEFQERMLVAPPLASPQDSPPRASTTASGNSADSRTILGSGMSGLSSTVAPTASSSRPNGGSAFTIFKDAAGSYSNSNGAQWDDMGTVKSRRRENEIDAKPWKGETLPMTNAATGKPAPFKLEVFRDPDAVPAPVTAHEVTGDVFTRSLRGPSEVETLRRNPFANFSADDQQLAHVDPLAGLENLPSSAPDPVASASATVAPSHSRKGSSKGKRDDKKPNATAATKPTSERTAVNLGAVYPQPGMEFSFEELMLTSRMAQPGELTDGWSLWEHRSAYDEETRRTARNSYFIDPETSYPLTRHPVTDEPLFEFACPESEPEPEAMPSSSASEVVDPSSNASSPSRTAESSFSVNRRAPSPTINTRLATDMIDHLFAKTLDFGKIDGADGDSDSEPSTEDEDEDDRPEWADLPHSQLNQASQLSQSTSMAPSQEDAPFVPFSQTASQFDEDSIMPSQVSVLSDLVERSHEDGPCTNDENVVVANQPLVPAMQLYRDPSSAPPATPGGAFKPVKRAPLGTKPLGLASKPVTNMDVFRDEQPAALDEEVDEDAAGGDSFEDYEAPLRDDDDAAIGSNMNDGFAMGRREKGVPSKYAPFVDAMTPVKEATTEYTSGYTTSSLSNSQRSRRESAFATSAPVAEEDEDEDDDDEEDDADRAFVAEDNDEDSAGSGSSDSDESDSDDEPTPVVAQFQPIAEQVPLQQDISSWQHESTRKDGQFDASVADESVAVVSHDPSFETSLNASLPEGFTIDGNQSGMTTGMVLTETTNLPTLGENNNRETAVRSGVVPINPFLTATMDAILAATPNRVLDHADVRNFTSQTADNLTSLQKTAKRRQSRRVSRDKTGVIEDAWEVQLGNDVFSVRDKLGEGAYGAVFRMAQPADPDASFDVDAVDDESSLAVKVQTPSSMWEFFVLDRIHSRVDKWTSRAVVKAEKLYAFQDESYLMLEYCDQGSLLDAVNKSNEAGVAPSTGGVGQGLDELVAMFFVIELLRAIEGLHEAGFIHGDIKIDNCLVRFQDVPGGTRAWASAYDADGGNGWSCKGIKLIDFGRAIDTTLFPPGQQFISDVHAIPQDAAHQALADCPEMRAGEHWTYEPDYYGIASIAFNLLFGKYMETKQTVENGQTTWAIDQPFRRYHQADLWSKLFDVLLNPRTVRKDQSLPVTDELRQIRLEMQDWLAKNSDRNGKSLKSLIRKIEIFAMSK